MLCAPSDDGITVRVRLLAATPLDDEGFVLLDQFTLLLVAGRITRIENLREVLPLALANCPGA